MTDDDCKAKCTADTTKPCKAYEFIAVPDATCKHYYGELFVDASKTDQKCNLQVKTTKTVEANADDTKTPVSGAKVDEEIPEDD